MLVVVKHGDLHSFAEFALDDETFGGLDVLQIDGAECGLERGVAFHDGLAGQRSYGTESKHGGPVGDDADENAAAGVAKYVGRIRDDCLAGDGDARGIRHGEIILVDQLLGRSNGELSRSRKLVVVKRGLLQVDLGAHGRYLSGTVGLLW